MMKKFVLFLLLLVIKSYCLVSQNSFPVTLNQSTDNRIIPSGCTVITISKGENVFFGGNDDFINPDS
jgi:hypothetical protein